MYDKNAMEHVNLWLEENKNKVNNDCNNHNDNCECESLDDWEDVETNNLPNVNRVSSSKTTVMEPVNLDVNNGHYDNSYDDAHNEQHKEQKHEPRTFSERRAEVSSMNKYWYIIAAVVYLLMKYFHVIGH